jgi:hypothetical protein
MGLHDVDVGARAREHVEETAAFDQTMSSTVDHYPRAQDRLLSFSLRPSASRTGSTSRCDRPLADRLDLLLTSKRS